MAKRKNKKVDDVAIDTRGRILEAARNLLLKRSGGEVSMAEIAKEAGVSRQAVYLHFADRVSLFVALVKYVDEKRGLPAVELALPDRHDDGGDSITD